MRDEFASKMTIRAQERAEETKNPRGGVDTSHFDVAREIGAARMSESDAKFNEGVYDLSIARGKGARRSCTTMRFRAK